MQKPNPCENLNSVQREWHRLFSLDPFIIRWCLLWLQKGVFLKWEIPNGRMIYGKSKAHGWFGTTWYQETSRMFSAPWSPTEQWHGRRPSDPCPCRSWKRYPQKIGSQKSPRTSPNSRSSPWKWNGWVKWTGASPVFNDVSEIMTCWLKSEPTYDRSSLDTVTTSF